MFVWASFDIQNVRTICFPRLGFPFKCGNPSVKRHILMAIKVIKIKRRFLFFINFILHITVMRGIKISLSHDGESSQKHEALSAKLQHCGKILFSNPVERP